MSDRIIAIGDIHGCSETLSSLLLIIKPDKTDTLVFIGDYIDRGPRIKQTIDQLINLKESGYNTVFILGNHEKLLLDALTSPRQMHIWLFNGADETLSSFGISSITKLNKKYIQFFTKLKHYHTTGNYMFSHAGFADNSTKALVDIEKMLWTRNEIYRDPFFRNKQIIHGHTPIPVSELQQRIKNQSNVFNIDTGCVYTRRENLGFLTAIEFPSKKLCSHKNID
ncbi:MAG: serine/threonine protein phosphatase [Bacteroidales bacterium]|nr:serine/threonine protein phosphatase [Bacteroidales bacterium]MBN2819204.1 serine/threonine protein phosphatase [Bacteroidales bacterium]